MPTSFEREYMCKFIPPEDVFDFKMNGKMYRGVITSAALHGYGIGIPVFLAEEADEPSHDTEISDELDLFYSQFKIIKERDGAV